MIIRLQLLQGTFQLGCAAFSGINPFEGCDGRQMASYGSFGPYQTLRSVDIPKQTCVLSAVEHSFTNDASLIPTSHATGMFWASYRCAVSDPSLGKLLDASICAAYPHSGPHRLTVRTPGFHPGNRGSIPLEVTNLKAPLRVGFLDC